MASKLTDTELTVGTDGHKVTGVDADGKALTSGSQVEQTGIEPDYTLAYSTRTSGNTSSGHSYQSFTKYLKSSKQDLTKRSLSEAVKFLAQYTSHVYFEEKCTCNTVYNCGRDRECDNDHDDR